jgi:hypothetical protein
VTEKPPQFVHLTKMKKSLATKKAVAESLSDSDVSDDDIELDGIESVDEDAVPRQKIEVDDKVDYLRDYEDIFA